MSVYTTAKSIGLVLNQTGVYFEGLRRPLQVLICKDNPNPSDTITSESGVVLERYFTDLYNLFLSRVTSLVSSNKITDVESDKIKSLLDEMIKVKSLIEKADKSKS